jgi:hypothetical protein
MNKISELNKSHIISTDEDPGLRIESFAVINLRGVSTNKTIIYLIAMQTYKETICLENSAHRFLKILVTIICYELNFSGKHIPKHPLQV